MAVPDRQFQNMRLLMWSLPLYTVWFGICWGVLAQNIPPYSAAYPTSDLARHFADHSTALRLGYGLAAVSTTLWMTWSIALFGIMRRMEGGASLLSYVQLIGGALTTPVPMFACLVWLTAALRPEQDPAIIQMLYDLGWMIIDIGFGPTTVQMVVLGVFFLRDKRPVPFVPKWVNWLGIWVGVEFFAEIIMPFFRSGPFSWAGLFNYWIPFDGTFLWAVILTFYMFRAINRLEEEAAEKRPVAMAVAA